MSMLKLKLEKLDARHNGHRLFSHRVAIYGLKLEQATKLIELREWCEYTFGKTVERDLVLYFAGNKSNLTEFKSEFDILNPKWSWHFDTKTFDLPYIYFKGQAELTLFQLKWL
jgi:hypothetical protein